MTDRCLDSHCEHPDHRDSKPPGAATDPLDTVPPEERKRIVAVAQKAAEHAWRFAGDSAKEPEYCAAIAREVAAYHARTDVPRLTPAEEAEIIASAPGQIGPGQTPIGRPPSTIAAAFEAMLAFLQMLIARKFSGLYTPAVRIGVEAAEQVDLTHWHAQQSTLAFRDLIQRAAEEHARGPVPPGFAEYEAHLAATATPAQKASAEQWAEGAERVTDADLAEIDARTSGPGPLAGDGDLLRRCAAEIRRLTAKLAGIEGVAAQGDGMMATISEQAAEIERLTRERPPAAASLEARAKIAMLAHDASPPAVFGGPWENAAPECHAAWIAVVRAVDASRPGLMCAECHRSVGRDVAHIDCEAPELGLVSDEHGYRAGSVDSAVATVVRAMGRPGLTEEEALATAGPLSRDIYNRIGLATGNKIGAPEWMRDAIAAALLRASSGATAAASALPIDHPGVRDALRALAVAMCATHARDPEQKAQLQRGAEAHDALRYALGDKDPAAEDAIPPVRFPGDVAIPRAILEKLAKAAESDVGAREARWAAERILQRTTVAAEPARTDPLHARILAEATQIDARLTEPAPDSIGPRGSSYDGAHAPARMLCPTCERWHFPTDCCQA